MRHDLLIYSPIKKVLGCLQVWGTTDISSSNPCADPHLNIGFQLKTVGSHTELRVSFVDAFQQY